MLAFEHGAREIDSWHMWILFDEAAGAGGHQAVFVIDRRVLHGDRHIALRQARLVQLPNGGSNGPADVIDHQCCEHDVAPLAVLQEPTNWTIIAICLGKARYA
jgi:hypothetical protein